MPHLCDSTSNLNKPIYPKLGNSVFVFVYGVGCKMHRAAMHHDMVLYSRM